MAQKNVLTGAKKKKALAHYQRNELDEARRLYEQVCRKDKRDAEAWSMLGMVNAALNDIAGAEQCFRNVVALSPKSADAHYNLARSLELRGQLEAAAEHYRKALFFSRNQLPEAANNLGNVYREQGRAEEALACYRQALQINPQHFRAHNNQGVTLQSLGCFDDAAASYRQAIQLKPDYVEAYYNLGNLYKAQLQLDEALVFYDKALALDANHPQAHWNKALAQLAAGRFEQGWQEYGWGFAAGERSMCYSPYPFWDGSSLHGRTILVQSEQGIGDEIMLASCLPDLIRDAGHCVIECEPRLAPLFAHAFPRATTIGRPKDDQQAWLSQLPHVDVKTAAGSLPGIYRRSHDDFPATTGYLRADEALARQWARRLEACGAGLKVGVSWRGGGNPHVRRQRSVAPEHWQPVFNRDGAAFINLQYDSDEHELNDIYNRLGVKLHHWGEIEPLHDLEQFVALISNLDVVISVDNSTVHLAGALGRPVWVLLPYEADWRWMVGREDSPWYPSARLFRQPRPGQWQPVFDAVARKLAEFK